MSACQLGSTSQDQVLLQSFLAIDFNVCISSFKLSSCYFNFISPSLASPTAFSLKL